MRHFVTPISMFSGQFGDLTIDICFDLGKWLSVDENVNCWFGEWLYMECHVNDIDIVLCQEF